MSENAKAVANDILEEVGKGRIPKKTKIQEKRGYSKSSARAGKALQTKAYKEEMRPIVSRLEKERQRIIKALETKDLDEERYKDLVDGMDKITKNIQLLGNKPTEITKHQLTDDEMDEIDELLD